MGRVFHHGFIAFLLMALMAASAGCTLLQPGSQAATALPELILFVQTAAGGTLAPVSATEETYRLTLQDVSPKVLYFADKPYRDSGSMSVEAYLADIFDPLLTNPNAALVVAPDSSSDQHTLALELSEPSYNPSANTLSYLVRPIADVSDGLRHLSFDPVETMPAQFGAAELFIDSSNWHRCNVEFVNYTDIPLTLDTFALDPPHNSVHWNPEPAASIEQFGGSKFTFRFHAHDDERNASYTYKWGDGENQKVRFTFGCSTTTYNQTAQVTTNECYTASSQYTCSISHKDNTVTHRLDVK